jgi:hypothetical protein
MAMMYEAIRSGGFDESHLALVRIAEAGGRARFLLGPGQMKFIGEVYDRLNDIRRRAMIHPPIKDAVAHARSAYEIAGHD